jgi:hypothetical protein
MTYRLYMRLLQSALDILSFLFFRHTVNEGMKIWTSDYRRAGEHNCFLPRITMRPMIHNYDNRQDEIIVRFMSIAIAAFLITATVVYAYSMNTF